MATASFLFHDKNALLDWRADSQVGVENDRAADLRILQDGLLHTRIGEYIALFPPGLTDRVFDTLGVAHIGGSFDIQVTGHDNTLIDKENQIHRISGAGAIGGIFILMQGADTMALLLAGNIIEEEVFYPKGWQPVFVRGSDDIVQMSNNGYPINRQRRRMAVDFTIPLRFLNTARAQGSIKALIERLQEQTCLYKADVGHEAIYCWSVGKSAQYRYVAPGLLETTLKMQGYLSYE